MAFLKRRDVQVTLVILVIAAAMYFALGLQNNPNRAYDKQAPQGNVVVYLGEQVYTVVPFGVEQDVVVEQENGAKNVVHVGHDGVHMASSTCDNQLCVEQGEVTLDNIESRPLWGWIVCLPNQVSIEVQPLEDAA